MGFKVAMSTTLIYSAALLSCTGFSMPEKQMRAIATSAFVVEVSGLIYAACFSSDMRVF